MTRRAAARRALRSAAGIVAKSSIVREVMYSTNSSAVIRGERAGFFALRMRTLYHAVASSGVYERVDIHLAQGRAILGSSPKSAADVTS